MSASSSRPRPCHFLLYIATALPALAARIPVSTMPALQTAINASVPGDTIVVADGVYNPGSTLNITRQGTQEKPIVITAATIGGAEIGGSGGFAIAGPSKYIEIRGFKLTHQAGGNKILAGASFCRFSHNLFECKGTGDYIHLVGDDNQIDYNTFQHKTTEYQMVEVLGPAGNAMAKRNWIHHNYFWDFKNTNANNSAAIEVGYSSRSMDSSFTLIEWNLFIDCRGENEGAICVKSSNAIIRYNTVGKGSTEISIRHGNHSQIYGNILMSTEGGLRFYGNDHRIYNNYFYDCSPALVIGNGAVQIPPGPLDEHDIPDRCEVVFNTFFNNRENPLMQNESGHKGANDLKFCNNLIVGGNKALDLGGATPGAVWDGNVIWNTSGGAGSLPSSGYQTLDPKLAPSPAGIYHLQAGSPVIGKAKGTFPYVTEDMDGQPRSGALDVGADQYSASTAPSRLLTPDMVGPQAPLPVALAPATQKRESLLHTAPRMLLLVAPPSALLPARLSGADGRLAPFSQAPQGSAHSLPAGAWLILPDHK